MNPWLIVGFLLALIFTGLGSCSYGKHLGKQSCAAAAGGQLIKTKATQDGRDAVIEVIAAQTTVAAAASANETRTNTHEAIARIHTVVVPGDCRDVDPVIVQEHAEVRDRINTKIRSGVRPASTGTDSASANH